MKNVLAVLGAWSAIAFSQTVILYEDGSQYTLGHGEHIYISIYDTLYQKKQYNKGDYYVRNYPSEKRDYVPSYENTSEVGSQEWCESFDTSASFSFATISWDRYCDINDDGQYDMCDWYEPTGIMTFQEIEYQKQCTNGSGS
jgi:hypothetical protein